MMTMSAMCPDSCLCEHVTDASCVLLLLLLMPLLLLSLSLLLLLLWRRLPSGFSSSSSSTPSDYIYCFQSAFPVETGALSLTLLLAIHVHSTWRTQPRQ